MKHWHLNNTDIMSVHVADNNAFRIRKIFNSHWRESVKPLQYRCKYLPASMLIDLRKKICHRSNAILCSLAKESRHLCKWQTVMADFY